MTLTEAVASLKLPVLVYEYKSSTGYTFVTADVLLLSGACIKDVHVEIDPTGLWITIWQKIPETFLAVSRIRVEDDARGKESVATKGAALLDAVTDMRKKCPKFDGRTAMSFKFKLPLPCVRQSLRRSLSSPCIPTTTRLSAPKGIRAFTRSSTSTWKDLLNRKRAPRSSRKGKRLSAAH